MARSASFKEGINKPTPLDIEANPWWWNPGRLTVPRGPEWMREKLQGLDPNLEMTRNNYTGLFQVWMRKPTIQHKICAGWTLLFPVHPSNLGDGTQILARLYSSSQKVWGDGVKYFDAVVREIEREKEAGEKASLQDSLDHSMEVFNHSQISVSMRGKSNGSKWSTYHS